MEKEIVDSYIRAGNIADEIKKRLKNYVKPNVKLLDIANFVEYYIKEQGADIAFPTNLSINEIAAHYTPVPNDDKEAYGVLKIDFGVSVDGFIADTAISFDLTENNEYKQMLEINRSVLVNVMNNLSPDSAIEDVGNLVNDELEKQNKDKKTSYLLIHSLCGHGLGKDLIHTGMIVPNYRNRNLKKLNELAFAIEPFITDGNGDIYEGSEGNIYCINSDGQVRDRDARKMLEYIRENYKTRPFCERWLKEAGFLRVRYCLKILKQSRIIYEYPMLIEVGKGVVSQFENTFIITDGKIICTSEIS